MSEITERSENGQSWLEVGAGDAMVLVHGIGGSADTWRPVMQALGRSCRVYAWNFPGYGGADALFEDAPAAGDYARSLLKFMDQRNIAAAHLVGHSLGAVVVASLATLAPERVSRLSLICPVVGAGHLPVADREALRLTRRNEILTEGMAAFANARTASIIGSNASPADVVGITASMAKIPQSAYLQAWEMLCAAQILPLLDPDIAPAMVLGGDADPVAPPDAVSRVAQALAAEPTILKSVGHFPTHEATETLVEMIVRRSR